MKRIIFLIMTLVSLGSVSFGGMTNSASAIKPGSSIFTTNAPGNPLTLFCAEVETQIEAWTLEGGTTLTFPTYGLIIAETANNVLTITENSEDLVLTFATNAVNLSSTTGVVSMDWAIIVPKADQFLFDPVADAVGTVEGTVYYDSDDDNLYVRTTAGLVDLTAGAGVPAGADTQIQYNNGGAFGGIAGFIWDDTNIEIADDIDFAFGTDADWLVQYDEAVDNQLLFLTANTSAIATTDPMVEFIVGATPTADQQVFGIAKGTQASNTALFTVDEDGDTEITGSLTAGSWSIGTFSTTGVTSLGNGTATVAVNSSSWDITTGGAASGFTTLSMSGDLTNTGGDILLANGKGVKSSTTTAETAGLYGYDTDGAAYVGAVVITNSATPATVLGNANGTTAITSSDWAISTAGVVTGAGAITADGLFTGSAGATITGAAVNFNANSNFAANVCTGTSTGAISLGGGSGTFAVASTGVDISTAGAVSNVTTLSCTDDIDLANGKSLKSSTTTGQTVKLKVYDNDTGPAYVDALTLTNGNAPATSIGGNATTVAIDSTDWDISATGAMTGIGAITADGLVTGSLGATITGATVALNESSNFGVNVCTGTSTGAIALGNNGGTVAINSSDWDVSATGVITGVASTGYDSGTVVYHDTIEITAAEIKALRATKKQLIAAPGATNFVEVLSTVIILDKGTEVLTESADNLVVQYATSGQDITGAIETTGFIDQAADQMAFILPATIATVTAANVANNAVELFNTGDSEYGGNASNDAALTVKISYYIHPTGL